MAGSDRERCAWCGDQTLTERPTVRSSRVNGVESTRRPPQTKRHVYAENAPTTAFNPCLVDRTGRDAPNGGCHRWILRSESEEIEFFPCTCAVASSAAETPARQAYPPPCFPRFPINFPRIGLGDFRPLRTRWPPLKLPNSY